MFWRNLLHPHLVQKQEAAGSFEMLVSLTSQKTVIFNHEFHIQTAIEFALDAANSCLVAVKLCKECYSHSFIAKSVLLSKFTRDQ
jgi:hypothetical protein